MTSDSPESLAGHLFLPPILWLGKPNVPRGKGVLAPGRAAPSLPAAGRGGRDSGVFGGISSSRTKPCWLTWGRATVSEKRGVRGGHRPGITSPWYLGRFYKTWAHPQQSLCPLWDRETGRGEDKLFQAPAGRRCKLGRGSVQLGMNTPPAGNALGRVLSVTGTEIPTSVNLPPFPVAPS